MGDARILPVLVLVALVAATALGALLVASISRPGPGRAGLVAFGLPVSLLGPVLAAAYGSGRLVGFFGGMPGESRAMLEAFDSLWAVPRLAWGACALSSLVGLVLGAWRTGAAGDARACSVRRGAVILLLAVMSLVVAGLATRPLASGLRVASALASSDARSPASQERADAVLEAEGLPTGGAGSLGAAARFLTRAGLLGLFGGVTAVVVLLGLAIPGLILAWRVRFGLPFAAAASALWLAATVLGAAVSLGALDPLR